MYLIYLLLLLLFVAVVDICCLDLIIDVVGTDTVESKKFVIEREEAGEFRVFRISRKMERFTVTFSS